MPKGTDDDLIGQRFGRLIVVEDAGRIYRTKHKGWLCRCDCGQNVVVAGGSLKKGLTISCGCFRRETSKKQARKNLRHGAARLGAVTPEYLAWGSMRKRCLNPKHKDYRNYGGRGIRICDRWESFEAFVEDMGLRPSPQHSIDRIDVNGNYELANCRWATTKQQMNNQRKRARIDQFSNEELLREFCKRGAFWADVPLSFGV